MSTIILNLILWVPFGFLFFIYGVIFCVSGYQKGLYRALISVGATVLAGGVSILVSRLTSAKISQMIYNAIPTEKLGLEGASAQLFGVFIKGAIQNIVALVMFSLLLFILSIVFKCICSKIKPDKLLTENKALKWAGLAVRFVDALVVVLLLMLPLYGTVAAYAPAVKSLATSDIIAGEKDMSDVVEVLDVLTSHPIIKASGTGPVGMVYKGLSDIKAGEGTLNVPEMAETSEELVTMIMNLPNVPEEQMNEEVQKIIVYMRKNVVNKSWFYGLFNTVKGEAIKLLEENSAEIPPEARGIIDEIIKSLDISEEQLQDASEEFLDFAEYVLKNRLIERAEEEELAVLYNDEFLSRFGKLANCNEVALSVKRIINMMSLMEFFGSSDEAIRFLNEHPITLKTDEALQKREAGALLIMMKGGKALVQLEALVRQPDFGFDTMRPYIDEKLLSESVYHGYSDGEDNPLSTYLKNNPDVFNVILNKLKECETTQPSKDYFSEYADEILFGIMREQGIGGGYMGGETSTESGGETYYYYVDEDGNVHIVGGNGEVVSESEITSGGSFSVITKDGVFRVGS